MTGYVYITGTGTDPAASGNLNDPVLGKKPTLGACMPNVRRIVKLGDYIFVVSGKVPNIQQYVVGGLRVKEKITALAAYDRFPENRLSFDDHGRLSGNIIVDAAGNQNPLDRHASDTFERRIQNYIVGTDAIALTSPAEVERGRAETLERLSTILQRPRGNRVIDVMGRWAKLDDAQVAHMLEWLRGIKGTTT